MAAAALAADEEELPQDCEDITTLPETAPLRHMQSTPPPCAEVRTPQLTPAAPPKSSFETPMRMALEAAAASNADARALAAPPVPHIGDLFEGASDNLLADASLAHSEQKQVPITPAEVSQLADVSRHLETPIPRLASPMPIPAPAPAPAPAAAAAEEDADSLDYDQKEDALKKLDGQISHPFRKVRRPPRCVTIPDAKLPVDGEPYVVPRHSVLARVWGVQSILRIKGGESASRVSYSGTIDEIRSELVFFKIHDAYVPAVSLLKDTHVTVYELHSFCATELRKLYASDDTPLENRTWFFLAESTIADVVGGMLPTRLLASEKSSASLTFHSGRWPALTPGATNFFAAPGMLMRDIELGKPTLHCSLSTEETVRSLAFLKSHLSTHNLFRILHRLVGQYDKLKFGTLVADVLLDVKTKVCVARSGREEVAPTKEPETYAHACARLSTKPAGGAKFSSEAVSVQRAINTCIVDTVAADGSQVSRCAVQFWPHHIPPNCDSAIRWYSGLVQKMAEARGHLTGHYEVKTDGTATLKCILPTLVYDGMITGHAKHPPQECAMVMRISRIVFHRAMVKHPAFADTLNANIKSTEFICPKLNTDQLADVHRFGSCETWLTKETAIEVLDKPTKTFLVSAAAWKDVRGVTKEKAAEAHLSYLSRAYWRDASHRGFAYYDSAQPLNRPEWTGLDSHDAMLKKLKRRSPVELATPAAKRQKTKVSSASAEESSETEDEKEAPPPVSRRAAAAASAASTTEPSFSASLIAEVMKKLPLAMRQGAAILKSGQDFELRIIKKP